MFFRIISLACVVTLVCNIGCKKRSSSSEKSVARKDGQDLVVLQVNNTTGNPIVQYKKCLAKDIEAAKAANPNLPGADVNVCTGPDVAEALPEHVYFGILSVLLGYRDLSAEEKRLSWYYLNLEKVIKNERVEYETALKVAPEVAKSSFTPGTAVTSIQNLVKLKDSLAQVNSKATALRADLLDQLRNDTRLSAGAINVLNDLAGKITSLEGTRAAYADSMMRYNAVREHVKSENNKNEKYVVVAGESDQIWIDAIKPFDFIKENGGIKAFKATVENYQWYNDFGAEKQFTVFEAISACQNASTIARFPTKKELLAFYLQLVMKDSGMNPNSTEAKKYFSNSIMWYWIFDDMYFSDSNFVFNAGMMSPKSGDMKQSLATALDFEGKSKADSLLKANLICIANPEAPKVTEMLPKGVSPVQVFPKNMDEISSKLKSGKAAKRGAIVTDIAKAKRDLEELEKSVKEADEALSQIAAAIDDVEIKRRDSTDTEAGGQYKDVIAQLKTLRLQTDKTRSEMLTKLNDSKSAVQALESQAAQLQRLNFRIAILIGKDAC